MSVETWAGAVVVAVGIYAALGFLFALAFLARGVDKVDPAATGASIGFRLVVLPGVVALWPLLARRWLAGGARPPVESTAHRRAARGPREVER